MGLVGRPPKSLKALQAQYFELLRKGLHRKHAAAQLGLTEATISDWYHKGARETKGIYYDFHCGVNRAESEYAQVCLDMLTAQGARDPKIIQWVLSRRFPELYGRKDNVEEVSPEDRAAQEQAMRQLLLERLERLIPEKKTEELEEPTNVPDDQKT